MAWSCLFILQFSVYLYRKLSLSISMPTASIVSEDNTCIAEAQILQIPDILQIVHNEKKRYLYLKLDFNKLGYIFETYLQRHSGVTTPEI